MILRPQKPAPALALRNYTGTPVTLSTSGRIAVVYPPNFTPAQIVHDVPLLARS